MYDNELFHPFTDLIIAFIYLFQTQRSIDRRTDRRTDGHSQTETDRQRDELSKNTEAKTVSDLAYVKHALALLHDRPKQHCVCGENASLKYSAAFKSI